MGRTSIEAIDSYITDMLALEEHIEKAVSAQLRAFRDDYPALGHELQEILYTLNRHILTIRAYNETRQAGATESVAKTVKRAAATIVGLGAAAVDLVRTEKLPKDLRDDYTAFSLASIGYLMLLTTAQSLGDAATAEIARRHFADYAQMTIRLHNLTPATVISLLQEEGLPASDTVLPEIRQTIEEVWTSGAPDRPGADELQVR
jgi:ferritin-like metal-binding protein YciE